ncbi:MAG: hypothetical protein KDC35_20900 [Acidobacteria bacterium]|nr:hypothetical protein [Acidobacteriota bacterium]
MFKDKLGLKIFLISFSSLFIEIMFIRWISTEIRVFAYVQNTVLISCFLGLGLGCFTSNRRSSLLKMLIPMAIVITLFASPFTRNLLDKWTQHLGSISNMVIWGIPTGSDFTSTGQLILGFLSILAVMALMVSVFIPPGRWLGLWLDQHPNTIVAYSINIAGSLAGIWVFVLACAAHWPPFLWVLIALASLGFLFSEEKNRTYSALAFVVTLLLAYPTSWNPSSIRSTWSNYQKLVLYKHDQKGRIWPGKYLVTVNNVGYQAMIDLSPDNLKARPDIFPQEWHGYSQYDLPTLIVPEANRVLIVGAGSGNDVAGAIRGGAKHVVAVEIDDVIVSMGKQFHPENPYAHPNVDVVVDDARAYFSRATDTFDLIIFGLLDSHTTGSMTNARLDHYVYTEESLIKAKKLLANNGVMVLSFEAEKPYIADRIMTMLTKAFHQAPIAFRVPASPSGWGGVMFITGDNDRIQESLANNPKLRALIADWQARFPLEITGETPTTTDDWPYLYLERPTIPNLYYIFSLALLILFFVFSKLNQTPIDFRAWTKSHWHFFFLGAGFLLLEVQNISRAVIILGSTWLVNAVIISGILAMILLSNLVVAKLQTIKLRPVYAGLIASCVFLYFFDLSVIGAYSFATKCVLAGLITTLPIFFSGIIFIESFRHEARKDVALGANLFGSLIGGLTQAISFLVGTKALLLLVTLWYLASLIVRPRVP